MLWYYSIENNKKIKMNNYNVNKDLLWVMYREVTKKQLDAGTEIKDYTTLKTHIDDLQCMFHASSWYMDGPWYDWALVEFSHVHRSKNLSSDIYPWFLEISRLKSICCGYNKGRINGIGYNL